MVRKETENHVSSFFVTAFPSQFNNLHQIHSQHVNKSYAKWLTFFLFPPFPFIAYFNCAHRQNNGNNKEQNATHYTGRNGLQKNNVSFLEIWVKGITNLMFNTSGHWKLYLLTPLVTLGPVGENPEIVCSTTNQIFY